jgi:hypothetical protein
MKLHTGFWHRAPPKSMRMGFPATLDTLPRPSIISTYFIIGLAHEAWEDPENCIASRATQTKLASLLTSPMLSTRNIGFLRRNP